MRAAPARAARSAARLCDARLGRSRLSALLCPPDGRLSQASTALTFPSESLNGSGSRYVDDFEQIAQIGEGSFGTVFKCRKRVDSCHYAVKVTRKQVRSDVQRQDMLREVLALSAVSQSAHKGSSHILRYYNAWWEEGRLFIQTELCASSLADVMERTDGPLRPEVCTTVLEECLLGLSAIHSHDLCHLDIKVRARPAPSAAPCRGGPRGRARRMRGRPNSPPLPQHRPCPRAQPANIFVSGAQEAAYKLGDLGLARLKSNARDVIEGDSKYLPRELLHDDFSNMPMADIYSLGATVLEVALGRPLPGSGAEWQQLRDGHLPMAELHECPPDLTAVLRWMMHPDPQQRPTADELLRHPLFRSEMETLLHQERARSSGLQEKLQQVMDAKTGVGRFKRTITI